MLFQRVRSDGSISFLSDVYVSKMKYNESSSRFENYKNNNVEFIIMSLSQLGLGHYWF